MRSQPNRGLESRSMRFGFWPSSAHQWDQILAVSRAAEACGWDGLWLPDHFMPPVGGYGHEPPGVEPELLPTHECWTLLGALAAAVPRVRLGAMVTGNTYRHPAVLAKQAGHGRPRERRPAPCSASERAGRRTSTAAIGIGVRDGAEPGRHAGGGLRGDLRPVRQ